MSVYGTWARRPGSFGPYPASLADHSFQMATPAGATPRVPSNGFTAGEMGAVTFFAEKFVATQNPSRQSTKNCGGKFSIPTAAC